ncbi:MAG: hypothetical protein JXR51_08845 [Bacteroidales bacterium]|nr:hypothetical protein [Bacteroidales bacterium]MBN2757271.1 hypothetical protein [Bacteroidales bacterium]
MNLLKLISLNFFILISISAFSQNLSQIVIDINLPIDIDDYEKKLSVDIIKLDSINQESDYKLLLAKNALSNNKPTNNIQTSYLQPYNTFIDTVSFVVLIPEKKLKFLIIIGLTENLNVIYFYNTDKLIEKSRNLNQFNFNNNLEYFVVHQSFNNDNIIFKIFNPFYIEKKNKLNDRTFIENKGKINFQIGFSCGLNQGFSELSYSADTSKVISSVYYNSKIRAGYFIKTHFNAFYKKINLSLIIKYEKLDFEYNTRVITNILQSGNLYYSISQNGYWPTQMLYICISAYYDFQVVQNLFVSPSVSFSNFQYINPEKYFDESQKGTIENDFKNRFSYSLGINVKYAINNRYTVFSEFNHNTNLFNAESYFNDIKANSFSTRQITNNFGIGIYYRIK